MRRKYCSNSCNVLASYARTGNREARPSKADLERSLVTLIELMTGKERAAAPNPNKLAEMKIKAQEIKVKLLADSEKEELKEKLKEKLKQAAVKLKAVREKPVPTPKKRAR